MGFTYRKYPEEFVTSRNGVPDKLYMVWYDMMKRCRAGAREAARYFDKGVRVCEEWVYWPTFATWARAKGWAIGLEIDRIDGTLGYFPDNCRFVTELVQNHNRNWVSFRKNSTTAQRAAHARPFICIESGVIYQTHTEAQDDTGICRTCICDVLNGKHKSAGGFHWNYLTKVNTEETT